MELSPRLHICFLVWSMEKHFSCNYGVARIVCCPVKQLLLQRKNQKAKVWKFKYHEYKPPGSRDKDKNAAEKAQKNETPHEIIMKQQQLLLQLQVSSKSLGLELRELFQVSERVLFLSSRRDRSLPG